MAKRRKRKKKRKPSTDRSVKMSTESKPRDFTALFLSVCSYVLLWLAMPGQGVAILAWIAMAPMIWLIHSQRSPHKVIRQVWVASLIYWLVTLHFVRLPFWGLWFGWLLLATYLSIYGPMFVWISRSLVHRFKIPTVIAAPVVFTGLEWIRVTFLTGFGIACVSHSQYETPAALQIAEFFGAYGVTFLLLTVGSAVAVAISFIEKLAARSSGIVNRAIHAVIAIAVFVGAMGYGTQRLGQDQRNRKSAESHKHLKVALIQTSIDTVLRPRTEDELDAEFAHRRDLTHSARLIAKDLDLIVWPESSLDYRYADVLSDVSPTDTREARQRFQQMAWQAAIGKFAPFPDAIPMLVGSVSADPEKGTEFNSALLFDTDGFVTERYFKNHLVMFGEYFPVVHSVPILKDLLKGFRSLDAGTEFTSMAVGDVNIAPSICFETTVPHLIRRALNEVENQGQNIDAIVNVTNDGWFFGTSCLDLHLACNTMRAVEMRKPVLVAANTGFSAHIDELGRHVNVGPRREPKELICNVRIPTPTTTIYRGWGAWVACLMGCLALFVGLVSLVIPENAEPNHKADPPATNQ